MKEVIYVIAISLILAIQVVGIAVGLSSYKCEHYPTKKGHYLIMPGFKIGCFLQEDIK